MTSGHPLIRLEGLSKKFGPKYGIPVHYTPSYYEDVTYRISANELRVAPRHGITPAKAEIIAA